MHATRPEFAHSALLGRVRSAFDAALRGMKCCGKISLSDCFMSGMAIFSMKFPSMLQFDEVRTGVERKSKKSSEMVLCADDVIASGTGSAETAQELEKARIEKAQALKRESARVAHNLMSMYGIKRIPCDTYLRTRLDGQKLDVARTAFRSLFALLQRSKVLEFWKSFDDRFVISLDATGFFSSDKIHCDSCCRKVRKDEHGEEVVNYQHQMLVGAIVSPSIKQVLPIVFEPIAMSDGSSKNDCERNCAKKWLQHFRQSHPQLPTRIVADGLYSNAPFIRELIRHRCSYVLVAREGDHKHLFEYLRNGSITDSHEVTSGNKIRKYRFMNSVPLNAANPDLLVNVLHFEERDQKKNGIKKWVWITDTPITQHNAKHIQEIGRSRWKIENETFNTLKNQGFNFEHNYGHGYKTLANVFAGLMLLAFLIDQILEALNKEYRAIREKLGSKAALFELIRSTLQLFMITNFEKLYQCILTGPPVVVRL